MASCGKHHKELDENGEGKCSVPMWSGGVPAGFCDKVAYGGRSEGWFDDNHPVYTGYVPYLACPAHGGPKQKVNKEPS